MTINKKTTLKFPDEFFKEEVRCGYRVSVQTKKIWAIELDLLNELLKVCKKHNIQVCAFAGTILGAVRHQGFIPWDDDVDVALTRENYEKLLQVAPSEFKNQYFFQTFQTDPNYFFGYARLRNSLTTGIIVGNDRLDYNNGIYLDIFVLDGKVDDDALLKKQLKDRDKCTTLLNCYKMGYPSKNIIFRLIKYFLRFTYCNVVSYHKQVAKYEKIITKYNASSNKVALMTHPYSFIRKYWCYRDDLESIQWVSFENIQIPIPQNAKSLLANMYGDYMKFPPLEQRGTWHTGILEFDPDTPYQEYILKHKS